MTFERATRRFPFKGLLQLAIFQPRGLSEFGSDADAFLTSLAPFVALILVGAGITALAGEPREGALLLLRELCLLLMPPVVADLFCRFWKRSALWARYATVLNWSLWLQMMLLTFLYSVLVAARAGAIPDLLALAITFTAPLYLIAFHWFVARVSLSISHGRVALLLFTNVVLGVAILAASLYNVSPEALRRSLESPPDSPSANGSTL